MERHSCVSFPARLEIDLDQFDTNLRVLHQQLGPSCGLLLVVKADAYGHGATRMALEAGEEVSRFGVATLHEGIELRAAGVTRPILILSPTLLDEIDEILEHRLVPSVGTLEYARRLGAAATRRGLATPFQVELDTGIGRGGVSESEGFEFVRTVSEIPGLQLEGMYTHFPDADAPEVSFARDQVRRFLALVGQLRAARVKVPMIHAANSAGAVRIPESRLDLVRPGIVAYGLMPEERLQPFEGIRPVMSLKARLVQVRDLAVGATVSYGRTWRAARPTRLGVVPVGYGHGLSWLLSNHGEFLVRGQRVPIVGNVTMDITLVDLTGVPGVEGEDEVVIFGEQRGQSLTAHNLARLSGTLVYEVLCTIGRRVVREYRRGSRSENVTTLVGERQEIPAGEGVRVEYSRVPNRKETKP